MLWSHTLWLISWLLCGFQIDQTELPSCLCICLFSPSISSPFFLCGWWHEAWCILKVEPIHEDLTLLLWSKSSPSTWYADLCSPCIFELNWSDILVHTRTCLQPDTRRGNSQLIGQLCHVYNHINCEQRWASLQTKFHPVIVLAHTSKHPLLSAAWLTVCGNSILKRINNFLCNTLKEILS